MTKHTPSLKRRTLKHTIRQMTACKPSLINGKANKDDDDDDGSSDRRNTEEQPERVWEVICLGVDHVQRPAWRHADLERYSLNQLNSP